MLRVKKHIDERVFSSDCSRRQDHFPGDGFLQCQEDSSRLSVFMSCVTTTRSALSSIHAGVVATDAVFYNTDHEDGDDVVLVRLGQYSAGPGALSVCLAQRSSLSLQNILISILDYCSLAVRLTFRPRPPSNLL